MKREEDGILRSLLSSEVPPRCSLDSWAQPLGLIQPHPDSLCIRGVPGSILVGETELLHRLTAGRWVTEGPGTEAPGLSPTRLSFRVWVHLDSGDGHTYSCCPGALLLCRVGNKNKSPVLFILHTDLDSKLFLLSWICFPTLPRARGRPTWSVAACSLFCSTGEMSWKVNCDP